MTQRLCKNINSKHLSKIAVTQNNSKCQNCPINSSCLPLGLNQEERSNLAQLIQNHSNVNKNQHLVQIGESFSKFYIVQKGTFKSYVINIDGIEQINNFHFPGELLGIDGIYTQKHCMSIKALENSSVCEISFSIFLLLIAQIPGLQNRFFNIISYSYIRQLQLSINSNAETRFALFILNIFKRLSPKVGANFQLIMSREDIGNYLGLATETISRLFKIFVAKDILSVRNKQVKLNNFHALQLLSRE